MARKPEAICPSERLRLEWAIQVFVENRDQGEPSLPTKRNKRYIGAMMKTLRELGSFMKGVIGHWGILVTSNAVVGAIAIYEHYHGKIIPTLLLQITVYLSLFLAFFLAWRDERRKVEVLTGELAKESDIGQIGIELSRLYRSGLELKSEIVNSDDNLSIDESKNRLDDWCNDVYQMVETISSARAVHILEIASVEAAGIGGMKSKETKEKKNTMLLYHTERLRRLAELLKEY